ncbi:MAG: hypothetical protein WCQ77_00830 [Planctomycetota bacterium]
MAMAFSRNRGLICASSAVIQTARLGAVSLAFLPGCSPAPTPPAVVKPVAVQVDHDHDHGRPSDNDHDDHHDHDDHDHAHPETLAAAVTDLELLWGHVKGSLQSGDREKADDKVHMVGHLLEDFESLLAQESKAVEEAGKQAVGEVFDCFDSIDVALHADENDAKSKINLDKLSPRLEAAIKTLKDLVSGEAK